MVAARDLASICCSALSQLLPTETSYPGTVNYTTSQTSYWSAQEIAVAPACIVAPASTSDVSVAVGKLSSLGCPFAIRSAGHAPTAGFANIAGGVTIDLSGMSSVALSADGSTVTVGPGAAWGDVYKPLQSLNLTVAGGRDASVGVGGLTIGGGISLFSPRVGFTCDTVTNYEVVLASGKVVNANANQNPDLLWTLRGGSNNFGVVTAITYKTVATEGPIWGGNVYNSIDSVDQAFAAINALENNYDEYASVITSFVYASGVSLMVNNIQYTRPVPYPPSLEPFTSIPATFSDLRTDTIYDFATELHSLTPYGGRQWFGTVTHGISIPMLNASYNQWAAALADVAAVVNIKFVLVFEPFPPLLYNRAPPGSNPLGLSGQHTPLVVALLTTSWSDPADDAVVTAAATKVINGITAAARELGELNDYLYLNYASPSQDPLASYGAANLARLKSVSREYDPQQVFQNNVPGGFKLKDA